MDMSKTIITARSAGGWWSYVYSPVLFCFDNVLNIWRYINVKSRRKSWLGTFQRISWDFRAFPNAWCCACVGGYEFDLNSSIRRKTYKYLRKQSSNVRTMPVFHLYQSLYISNVNPFPRESMPFHNFQAVTTGSGTIRHTGTINTCTFICIRSRSKVGDDHIFHTCVVLMNISLTTWYVKCRKSHP